MQESYYLTLDATLAGHAGPRISRACVVDTPESARYRSAGDARRCEVFFPPQPVFLVATARGTYIYFFFPLPGDITRLIVRQVTPLAEPLRPNPAQLIA